MKNKRSFSKKNKVKTKKVLAKKIKITGSGKILRPHQLRSGHLRRHKSKSALRRYKKLFAVKKTEIKVIKRLLGRA
jgi:large subunit ribosomal protein L35